MQRHYWTLGPSVPREGPLYAVGYSPQPTEVTWEAHTDMRLSLEVTFLFAVLFQTVLCSFIVVAGRHG